MPTKKPVKKPVLKEGEGEIYVSISSGAFTNPKINAQKIIDTLQHHAVAPEFERLESQIFPEFYSINIYDTNGDIDEQLSDDALSMMERPGVKLWDKMKTTWRDCFVWGITILNPVFQNDKATETIKALRRLPPEGFALQSGTFTLNAQSSPLLPGIVLNFETNEVEFYQTENPPGYGVLKLDPEKLFVIRSMDSTEFYGTSKLIPLVPLINVHNFAWNAQTQKVNRIGAPVIFIRIKEPISPDDLTYADAVLKNWGKSTAFKLRENMEPIELKVTESEVALSTIDKIDRVIKDYFAPTSLFKKEGDTLGGNASAEVEIMALFVKGVHRWLASAFEPLIEDWLGRNGYTDFEAEIIIEEQASTSGAIEAEQAKVGFDTKSLTTNERREKLGLQPLSDEELLTLEEDFKKSAPPPNPFGGFGGNPMFQPGGQGQQPQGDQGAQGQQAQGDQGAVDQRFNQKTHDKEHQPDAIEVDLEADLNRVTERLAQRVFGTLKEVQ